MTAKIEDMRASVTILPVHSGDGYGFGGGAILTIGQFSFQFGEGRKEKSIADEIVKRWNAFEDAIASQKGGEA